MPQNSKNEDSFVFVLFCSFTSNFANVVLSLRGVVVQEYTVVLKSWDVDSICCWSLMRLFFCMRSSNMRFVRVS